MTQGVRWPIIPILATGVLQSCTADPIARSLLVTSPHAEAAVLASHPDLVNTSGEGEDAANARAVRLALRGQYDQALEQLPTRAPRRITRIAIQHNRDVIAYLKQRRQFAGSLALPDPRIGFGVRADRTSLSGAGTERRFTRLTETFEIDAAGLRLRLPYDSVFERGESSSFRGETELVLQAFVGKASEWPDVKLTGGIVALLQRSPVCADTQRGRLDAFLGWAQHWGPLASTIIVGAPSESGLCPGPCWVGGDAWLRWSASFDVHPTLQPAVAGSAATWFAKSTGSLLTLSPGLRFFLDDRQTSQLEVFEHTAFAEAGELSGRRFGADLSFSTRWW